MVCVICFCGFVWWKIFGIYIMHIFRNIVIRKRNNPYEERNKTDDRYYRAFAEISNGELDTDGHIMGEYVEEFCASGEGWCSGKGFS